MQTGVKVIFDFNLKTGTALVSFSPSSHTLVDLFTATVMQDGAKGYEVKDYDHGVIEVYTNSEELSDLREDMKEMAKDIESEKIPEDIREGVTSMSYEMSEDRAKFVVQTNLGVDQVEDLLARG